MKLVTSATERTTAATDVILSAVAAGVVIYLQLLSRDPSWRISLWSWSFGLIALSAGCGAIYHGCSLADRLRRVLWQAITVCMGLAISLFLVAVVHDADGPQSAQHALPIMLTAGVAVFAFSRVRPGLFAVFIIYEAAALLIAFVFYIWMAASGTVKGAEWMAAGIAVSLVAAAIQPIKRLRFALLWEFDRNGLFHLVQGVGLVLLGVGLVQT
jgi:uncharacterized membrane protein YccC